jgi:hypothetical protein
MQKAVVNRPNGMIRYRMRFYFFSKLAAPGFNYQYMLGLKHSMHAGFSRV